MTEKLFQLLAFTVVCGIIYAIYLWSFTYKAPEKSVPEPAWSAGEGAVSGGYQNKH